jgi:hypothetical protein
VRHVELDSDALFVVAHEKFMRERAARGKSAIITSPGAYRILDAIFTNRPSASDSGDAG